MNKLKILFVIALACLLILPFTVRAEGEEETTTSESENKEVTLYFFRGEGCSHCAEFQAWLEEIEPEYGQYFEVKDYETWNDEDNADLMQQVAEARDEEANGVPYIIVGNKSWQGFADDYKSEILSEIQELYETNPSERYDIMALMNKAGTEKKEEDHTGDVIAIIVIILVAALAVFGIVKARKSAK